MKLCVHEFGLRAWLVGRGVEYFIGGLYRLSRQKLLSCELLETEAYVIYYVC
jgi:hypothetical protein